MGLSAYQQYAKKKPLDVDMSKLKTNLGQGAPLAGQGMSLNPSAATVRVMPLQPSREQAPYQAAQPQAPSLASGLGKMMANFRGAVQANTVNRAAQESAANVRDVAAPWAPSSNGSLADVMKLGAIPGGNKAPLGAGPGDSYQVPGLGAPQSMYYKAPQQRQTAAGTPDQSLNYGYEDRRATWYPQLSAEQRARAPWLNAGSDSAFKRALAAGFSADELTDATPWEGGQRFTPSGQRISLGQARLEGSVAPGYKPPAAAQAPGQQAQAQAGASASSLLALQNPYTKQVRDAWISEAQGDARARQAQAIEQARRDAASRGLSMAGVSGFEQNAQTLANLNFANESARAQREGLMRYADLGADWEMRRAGGLDQYDLANRGLLQSGEHFNKDLLLRTELGRGGLANDNRRLDLAAEEQRQTLPGRAEAIQVGNDATRAQTRRITSLTAPEVADAIARASESASRARVTGATEQDAIMRSGQQVQAGNIANESAQVKLAQARELSPLEVEQTRAQLDVANKQGIISKQTIEAAQYALDHKEELMASGKWAQWAPIVGAILAAALGNKDLVSGIASAPGVASMDFGG